MRCPYCGENLPDGSRFCTNCGQLLADLKERHGGVNQQFQRDSQSPGARRGQDYGEPYQRAPQPTSGRRKNRQNLYLVLAVILAALAVGAICIWKFAVGQQGGEDGNNSANSSHSESFFGDRSENGPEREEEGGSDRIAPESPTETPTPTPTKTRTPTPTPTPAYDPEEGGIHSYVFVTEDCTWTEAFQKAKEQGGYLARINSQEEWDYIISELNRQGLTRIQFRIGGRRNLDSHEYYWVDEYNQLYGEQINTPEYWSSSVWMSGEPSFQDGSTQEEYLDICFLSSENRWVLNDVPDDILATVSYFEGRLGYIIEYED